MNREDLIKMADVKCMHSSECGTECPYYLRDNRGFCKKLEERTNDELLAMINYKITEADGGERPDMVNKPNHYQLFGDKDCFDVMVEMFGKEAVQTYCVLNAFTYLFRHARKNGAEDVLKAEYNLAKFKELEESDDG